MSIVNYFTTYILISAVGVLQCLGNRIVETGAGRFRGAAASDGGYAEFLGIPYGQISAENPFGVATPHPVISGIYDANSDSVICPQEVNGVIRGSLDCLRLNIYTPTSVSAVSQLPVIVFIHGESFDNGSGTKELYGPRFILRHNVILVTINYRVGPYGFMCLNRRRAPGNQGLKDQVLALRWVRDNIRPFGGNPEQVTLFGQNTGGHSVELHLLSEQEKLYSKVIIQSGSSLAPNVIYEPDRNAPTKLATYLGLDYSDATKALTSLVNAPVNDVIGAASALNLQFRPCAETRFENVEAFITNPWINATVPKAQNLPILIGFNEYESLLTHINAGPVHFQGIANLVNNSLNQIFAFDEDRMTRMENIMRTFYFGDNTISQDVVWQVVNFESDYLYNHPIQRSISKYLESNASNIYYYMFAYSGNRNAVSFNNLNVQGASNADDLRYLFDVNSTAVQVSAQDQVIIDRMTTMWANFARYSDPTPSTTTLLPVKWTPITGDIYHYLRIDSNLTVARRPFNRRLAFWDLFVWINRGYQRSYEAIVAEDDEDNGSMAITSSFFNILLALTIVSAYRIYF